MIVVSNEWKDYIADSRQHVLSQFNKYGIPDGWRKSVVPKLVDELVDVLGSHVDDFVISDCKEKFGELRVYWHYDNPIDDDLLYDKIEEIIGKYELISRKTCVKCGRLTTTQSRGWILPFCSGCIKFVN